MILWELPWLAAAMDVFLDYRQRDGTPFSFIRRVNKILYLG